MKCRSLCRYNNTLSKTRSPVWTAYSQESPLSPPTRCSQPLTLCVQNFEESPFAKAMLYRTAFENTAGETVPHPRPELSEQYKELVWTSLQKAQASGRKKPLLVSQRAAPWRCLFKRPGSPCSSFPVCFPANPDGAPPHSYKEYPHCCLWQ